jgi:hypothetical protein
MDNIAATPFELGTPPGRYRLHTTVLALLAVVAFALSIVIWIYVPNESDSPLFGWLLDGLRDALLVLLWTVYALFASASTLALRVIPVRWHSAIRLSLAYLFGIVTLAVIAWLWLDSACSS